MIQTNPDGLTQNKWKSAYMYETKYVFYLNWMGITLIKENKHEGMHIHQSDVMASIVSPTVSGLT